jgi:hypothetical protein
MTELTHPSPDAAANGTKLVSRITSGGSKRVGTISDETGKVRWYYGPDRTSRPLTAGNPLRKPDFVLLDEGGLEALRVRRISFLPSAFSVVRDGESIGIARVGSLLKNKYDVEIGGTDAWTFYMPLFRVYFFGRSAAGPEVWVRIAPSEQQWNILLRPGLPELPAAGILAFIHNERYFYS